MLDSDIKVNLFLMQYCRTLVDDIPDERIAEQPIPGVNHPAWILGHLAFVADYIAGTLGAEKKIPEQWAALFRPGSKPNANRSSYPSKAELLTALDQGCERLRERAANATPEQLSKPTTNPRVKDALPTAKEFIAFLLTGHMGGHLGQISAWRRLIGMPPLF